MPSMRRIHIFRAGRQTAMSGVSIDFTEADMAATAAAYDPAKHEAPIVVGHPATDDPAHGWVRSLSASGADLFAEAHQVNPAFAELVQAGAYKKVSASFYPPQHPNNPTPGVYALRHVGYLGAQPPAVKGLKPTEFAEDAECVEIELDFSELTPPQEQPAEPSSLPPEQEAPDTGAGVSPEGSTPQPPEHTTVTPEEKAALEARNNQLQADLAAAQALLRTQAKAAMTAQHTAFAEQLLGEARIAEADRAAVVAMLDHFEPATIPGEQATVVEFGEGDAAKPMHEVFKAFLLALPQRVEFGEQARRDKAAGDKGGTGDAAGTVTYAEGTPAESIELDKRIRAYATEHKLSYAEAATAVAAQR